MNGVLRGMTLWSLLLSTALSQAISPISPLEIAPRASSKPVHSVPAGPWGRLEYFYTYLEAPESLLDLAPRPAAETSWYFKVPTQEEVLSLLQNLGVANELLPPRESRWWSEDRGGWRIYPAREVVEMLPGEVRQRLYLHLAQWPENRYQHQPIVIEESRLDQWFEGSPVASLLKPVVAEMAYSNGSSLLFSDVPYVLGLARTPDEETGILRALTRTRTLILRVRLSPSSDLEEISRYWSAESLNRGVLPILESVARSRGTETLDVMHLLPSIPRRQLYAYPSGADSTTGRFPDAFWTAVNFFSVRPLGRYLDDEDLMANLESDHVRVTPPFAFGDLVLVLRKEDEKVIHACNYIAGEIVYTKNGPDRFSPWTLMTVSDMLPHHQSGQDLLLRGYRRRDREEPVR